MTTKQKQKSDETRKNIVEASEKLFASKGYDTVTMREIAKEAGCSHTTIYIYFKDKEALLTQLSMPPLQALLLTFEAFLSQELPADDKLKAISLAFIEFCLANRNMYNLFFAVKSVRVDDEAPDMELNQLRNTMFGKLVIALQNCLQLNANDERALMYSRIYFFTLNGIVATYSDSEESAKELMNRLTPTFEQSSEVLLAGFRHQIAIY
ncbi:TetR/AcrR family transcriptional regulator [Paenibacillus sp. GSMTC-2017]|uniref:TetR/AcrR family transcriptional regulator n=1 Tax=Paenibacillus sp. GSMTC-2017 TaxID=2794350 RepID=UPI0018D831DF|nr:TetR/AcrR family transcriptional regulator [Paenibacillus sp. GSMTC-2017]